jgi:DNA-binding SARP family transcriptional activator
MAQAPTLELRLFGVGTITKASEVIVLATRKALALIAYLALEGTTTRGKLAWLLWSDLPEEAARNNLRKELFRLRETNLGTDLEITANQVTLKNFSSDVQEFNQLAGQSNEQALELSQQIFLDGLELKAANEFDNWLEQRRQIFRQATIGLWVTRASRLEAQSDLRNALEARLALVHLDALQEVHHREVMRLHWLLGEQAAALECFDALERILKTELGLKPLPESLELLKKIQNTTPEIKIIPQIRQRPNLSRPPLVGRETAWHFLGTRQHSFCLITGETGIGKTRLATDYATANGGYLSLRGYASAVNTPFYPIAEALRSALSNRRIDPNTMDTIWRNEIARLVPEFADQAPSLGSSFDGRAKFIESLARAIQAALHPNETLILDDLHWFDPSSFELIAHLARHNTKIIATARDLETSDNPNAQALLQTLEREGQLSRHALSHLSQSQTQMLLQTLSGRNAPLFTQRLHIASGGNPLLTLETLQGFFENGKLSLEPDGTWKSQIDTQTNDYTELPIPNNVRELVLGRIMHLGAAVKRILEVATLCATPFVSEDLLQASALSEWEAVNALERTVTAQVLTREQSQYRFKHDVVRRSLLEEFTPERQNLIHKRLSEQLIRSGGDPSRTAHHLEQSGRNQEAIPHLIKAALAARNLFAHQEARKIYDHALELQPDNKTKFSIHAQIAELELTLFNLDALEQQAQTMQALSHALPLEYSVKASLLTAKTQLYRGQFVQALETATQALEDSAGEARAEALLLLGTAYIGAGQIAQAKENVLKGLQIQKRGVIAAELHSSLKEVYRRLGDLPQALDQAQSAHGIYKILKNREQEIAELAQIGQLLGLLGRSEEALERLQRATKQAREYGLDRVLSVALVLLCAEQLRAGFFLEAQAPIEEGLALTKGKMLARECQFTAMLSKAQFRTGQLGNALQNAQLALSLSQGLGMQQTIQHLWIAEVFIMLGAYEKAKIHLQHAEEVLTDSKQEHWILLQILKAQAALGNKQMEIANELLQSIVNSYSTTRLEYQVKAACGFAHFYWLNKEPDLAIVHLEKLPPVLPNWLQLRVCRWRVLLGITVDIKKILKAAPNSLEKLALLEALAQQIPDSQKPKLQKQICEIRLTLEKSLEIDQRTQISPPKFGTFLEHLNI